MSRRRSSRPTARLATPAEKMAAIVAPACGDITARDTTRYFAGEAPAAGETIPMPFGW